MLNHKESIYIFDISNIRTIINSNYRDIDAKLLHNVMNFVISKVLSESYGFHLEDETFLLNKQVFYSTPYLKLIKDLEHVFEAQFFRYYNMFPRDLDNFRLVVEHDYNNAIIRVKPWKMKSDMS